MFAPKLRNLRDLRIRAGLTQEELAQRANLHAKTCANAERLAARPQLSTVQRLADALCVAPSDLWRTDTPQDVVALSGSLNDLVCRTLTVDDGTPWVEDQLVREFRHRLDGDHTTGDAVWQNIQDHAGFYAALNHLLRIAGWATATGNVPLLRVLHATVQTLVETSWHPLSEGDGEGGDHASP